MQCSSPIYAEKKDNGDVVFRKIGGTRIDIPCGRCIECKLEKARQWAGRCANEATMHKHNSFVTLTYSDDNLPKGGNLVKKHLQDFYKRLRYYTETNIKYYSCGEYGDRTNRPHYHAIIFGYQPEDMAYHTNNSQNERLYVSKTLDRIWGHGQTIIGAVTHQSAGYVARYTTKKITGPLAKYHYLRYDENGDPYLLEPEFGLMSTRPAIGESWYNKYHAQLHREDTWVVNGQPSRLPRYYDKLHKRRDSHSYELTKGERTKDGFDQYENSDERIAVKHEVLNTKIKALKRTL